MLNTRLWYLALGCFMTVTVQAETLLPLELKISDPEQSKGLTVLEITLPATDFVKEQDKSAQSPWNPGKWRVQGESEVLQQLYFNPSIVNNQVKLYGLLRKAQSNQLRFYYADEKGNFDKPIWTVPIEPKQAKVSTTSLLTGWANARHYGWYSGLNSSHLLGLWKTIAARVYGATEPYISPPLDARRQIREDAAARGGRRDELSAFSLFSGEAAIQETLQQQLLTDKQGDQPVPEKIHELRGPQVPSHPFTEMLQGETTDLPIAHLVPANRYFVHLTDTSKVLNWLKQIANTGSQVAGLIQQNYMERNLIDRYLKRLHLSYSLVEQLSPHIKQVAIFGPDLFLTEGSELTLILDSTDSPLLKTILIPLLALDKSQGVQTLGENPPAYFARSGQWLVFSTNRDEAQAALQLAQNEGKDSLGTSAEFRYMLAHLPQAADKQGILVYLSDPFIREMVGPRIKIAQYRRHKATVRLHLVTAAALLYQLDQGKQPTLDDLVNADYVDKTWLQSWEGDTITLNEEGIARSSSYGTLAEMKSLSTLSLETINQNEREAYKTYVDDYSRYWRTFFDPIGIRITMSNPLQIETLILPLVENSIYQGVQTILGGPPIDTALPQVTPAPITTVSFKIPATQWITPSDSKMLEPLLNQLGKSIHLMFYDNDPIIALGSADLVGAFSGMWLSEGFGRRGGEFLWIGMLASFLTQPTALWVELQSKSIAQDLSAQRRILDVLSHQLRYVSWFGSSPLELLGKAGDKGWVFTINLENVLRFHFYAQFVDNYLVISNWQTVFRSVAEKPAALPANVGLKVAFDQIKAMQPDLYLHQMQQRRTVSWSQMGKVLPFFFLGAQTVEQAMTRYQQLYGNRPLPASGETWTWQPIARTLESNWFGSTRLPKLPSYDDTDSSSLDTSPFNGLKDIDLRFQFEEAGVRIKVRVAY